MILKPALCSRQVVFWVECILFALLGWLKCWVGAEFTSLRPSQREIRIWCRMTWHTRIRSLWIILLWSLRSCPIRLRSIRSVPIGRNPLRIWWVCRWRRGPICSKVKLICQVGIIKFERSSRNSVEVVPLEFNNSRIPVILGESLLFPTAVLSKGYRSLKRVPYSSSIPRDTWFRPHLLSVEIDTIS